MPLARQSACELVNNICYQFKDLLGSSAAKPQQQYTTIIVAQNICFLPIQTFYKRCKTTSTIITTKHVNTRAGNILAKQLGSINNRTQVNRIAKLGNICLSAFRYEAYKEGEAMNPFHQRVPEPQAHLEVKYLSIRVLVGFSMLAPNTRNERKLKINTKCVNTHTHILQLCMCQLTGGNSLLLVLQHATFTYAQLICHFILYISLSFLKIYIFLLFAFIAIFIYILCYFHYVLRFLVPACYSEFSYYYSAFVLSISGLHLCGFCERLCLLSSGANPLKCYFTYKCQKN